MNEIREHIGQINEQINSLKEKLNELYTTIGKKREKLNVMVESLAKIIEEYNAICKRLKEVEAEIRRQNLLLKAQRIAQSLSRRREILKKKALKVYEKYKQGARLTLEEYRLLMEFNLLKP